MPAATQVAINILVPRSVAHTKRRPAYVSASTRSLSVVVNSGQPVVTNIAPTSAGCQTVAQGLSCTVSVSAQPGSDTFMITTFDGQNAAGAQLSSGRVTQTILSGQANQVAIALDGIVAKIVLATQSNPPVEGTSATVGLTVMAQDADGNTIVGPGSYDAPIALTDTDAQQTTQLSTLTVNDPTTAVSLAYNGKPLSSRGANALVGASQPNVAATAITPVYFVTAQTDWDTFGDSPSRGGVNASETQLTPQTVGGLHQVWSFTATGGGVINAQPVVAGNVTNTGHGPLDVLYLGDEHGSFYALNAGTGAVLWTKQLATQSVDPVATGCTDFPNGTYGISAAAQIDRGNGRVYTVDGAGQLYGLDLGTGTQKLGPVAVFPAGTTRQDHVYSGLMMAPDTGLLYVAIAAKCGLPNDGGIFSYNLTNGATARFIGAGNASLSAAGVWGPGGAVLDPTGATGDIFVTTADGPQAPGSYGSSVVRLSGALNVVAANAATGTAHTDLDFGGTPQVFTPSGGGCTHTLLVAGNKNGQLFVYNAAAIGAGPIQSLQIGVATEDGINIATPAYDAVTNLVFVNNGSDSADGTFIHGLLAFRVSAACTLSQVWNAAVGPNRASDGPPAPPTVANGVVYYADGPGQGCSTVGGTTCPPHPGDFYAFDARNGTTLAHIVLKGPLFSAPVVVNGHVYLTSWGGYGPGVVYALGV